jgi:hypothetical protein
VGNEREKKGPAPWAPAPFFLERDILKPIQPVEKSPIPDLKALNQLILLNAKKPYQPLLDFFDRHIGH